jgi:hypothetical protein
VLKTLKPKKGKKEKEKPVIDTFGLDEKFAQNILRDVEERVGNETIAKILQDTYNNKKMSYEEKMFTMYAIGFVGGRGHTLDEIQKVIGPDKFEYLLDALDKDVKKDDPMYQ